MGCLVRRPGTGVNVLSDWPGTGVVFGVVGVGSSRCFDFEWGSPIDLLGFGTFVVN